MAMNMNVALKINAGVSGQQAVDQLRTSMDKLGGAADAVDKGFVAAKVALGAFLGLQAVQGVLAFARSTINVADSMNDMSMQTGIAVETLSELDYAAKMNGASLEDVQKALTKVSVKATDAATGSKTAAVAFDVLGVSVKNADGTMRSSVDLLEDIGDSFRGISDPTVKAALAVEIFGKTGVQMIPVIENMRKSREEARELGGVLGSDFATQAAEFNDNVDRMEIMLRGLSVTVLNEVLPSLSQMFNELRVGIKVFGSFGSALWNLGTQNPFKDNAEHARDYYARIGELEASIKKLDATGTVYDRRNADRLREELESVRKLSSYYDQIQGIKRVEGGRGNVNPEFVKPAQEDPAAILARLEAAKKAEELQKQAAKNAADRAAVMQGLNDEITKMTLGEDLLTIAKLRALGASKEQIAEAERLLRQRAHLKTAAEDEAEATRRQKKLDDETLRNKEKLAEAGKRVFEETRTPAEKLSTELERLNGLLEQGAIDWDTYERASGKAITAFTDVEKKGKDTMETLKDAIDGWGRQATDAFVDFASGAKMSFGDLVSSILKDVARMVLQTMVMAPLMQAIKGMLPVTASANGNVMTSDGPMPLKKYANGGIARTPQLSLFGEGRMPEAYVPLPDGRTIPVTMKGGGSGGGDTNVVVNVNVENGQEQVQGEQGAGNLGRLIAGVVKAELINQKRPGGLLAA